MIKRKASTSVRRFATVVVIVICLIIIFNSWLVTIISDSMSQQRSGYDSQLSDYKAIQWIGQNTPKSSVFLSVSDWRFEYTDLLVGRKTYYQFFSTPMEAISYAKNINANYIIVTYVVTENLPPVPSLFPWNNFNSSSGLTIVYNSSNVKIFKIQS